MIIFKESNCLKQLDEIMGIKTKDLIDDKTSYSTTRWAFVVAMKFAISIAVVSFITFIIFRILKIDTEGLFSGVATVSGIVVGLATTAKALQGFEVKGNTDKPSGHDIEPEIDNKNEEVIDTGK